jgi:hypothetical protein
VPCAVMQEGVPDFGQCQALSILCDGFRSAAVELIASDFLFAIGVPKDDRIELATVAIVEAKRLFSLGHHLVEHSACGTLLHPRFRLKKSRTARPISRLS